MPMMMTTGSMTMTEEELVAVLRWRGSALQEGAFPAAADRIAQLTAERDRLRALVWAALDAWDIQDKDGGPMGDHWVSDARAALKGATP